MTHLPTYFAGLENGTWLIEVTSNEPGHGTVTYKVEDELLTDDERFTLSRGTSNDINNFVNNCGWF